MEETATEKFCAIKIAERKGLSYTKETIIIDECINQSKIESDYVVQLKSAIKTDNRYYLMLEYCNGGDLQHLMEAKEYKITGFVIHKIMT